MAMSYLSLTIMIFNNLLCILLVLYLYVFEIHQYPYCLWNGASMTKYDISGLQITSQCQKSECEKILCNYLRTPMTTVNIMLMNHMTLFSYIIEKDIIWILVMLTIFIELSVNIMNFSHTFYRHRNYLIDYDKYNF